MVFTVAAIVVLVVIGSAIAEKIPAVKKFIDSLPDYDD